jgi:hypothetical protein
MECSPTAIAERIEAEWAQHLARTARLPTAHDYVFASSWRTCTRRMVYELVAGDQQQPFTAEVLAKFRRGEDRERDLLADLTRIGRDAEPSFQLVSQQERFTLKDHKGRTAIVGKVDARLAIAGQRAPLEIKSWSPFLTDRIEHFEDLFENPWTRSGGYQLLAYLYGAGEPYGFILLDRSGLPRLLPVELDSNLDRMEEFLARAERVLDHVEAGTLPDYLDDAAECRRCPFYGSTCNPPLGATGAPRLISDPDLELALARREQFKAAAEEYDHADKYVKEQLRGIEHAIVGSFHIRGKWGKQSRIEGLPPDLQKQYTVTNPKGRFTLDIVKL